jgi:hypothetical protein
VPLLLLGTVSGALTATVVPLRVRVHVDVATAPPPLHVAVSCTTPPAELGSVAGLAIAVQPLGAVGEGGVELWMQVMMPLEMSKLSQPTMGSIAVAIAEEAARLEKRAMAATRKCFT